MNLKKIFILLFTLPLAISNNLLPAQSLSQAMDSAANAMVHKNYKESYLLFKRCSYFANENQRNEMLEPLAISAFYNGEYDEAIKAFTTLKNGINTNYKPSNEIMRLACLINLQQWEQLIDETNSLDVIKNDSSLLTNALFFRLLSFIQINNKEQAVKTAEELKSKVFFDNQHGFDSLMVAYKKDKFPNPQKAATLSYILPGLGQFYCKDSKNGLNALFLNGILIGGLVYTAYLYNWPSAVLFWLYYVPHYYIGNTRAAKEIAFQKGNDKKWHYFENFKKMAR